MKQYKELEKLFEKITDLSGVSAVMSWDSATMMPVGSSKDRGNLDATLSSVIHSLITGDGVGDLIKSVRDDSSGLNDWQKSNVNMMYHDWVHASAVDKNLVTKLSNLSVQTDMMWRKARSMNKYSLLEPYLQKMFDIVRQVAQCKSDFMGVDPYEALVDQFDPGRKISQIDAIFTDLENWLPKLLKKVVSKQENNGIVGDVKIAAGKDRQEKFFMSVMKSMGFNFKYGRLDTSAHPFCCGITSSDVRITTSYNQDDIWQALWAVIHETGHALYESKRPKLWSRQPVGRVCGMTIHESMSLFMEKQVATSHAFLSYLIPKIRQNFKLSNVNLDHDNLYRFINKVEPGEIRIYSDEMTYPLHILLRYRLEKYIISGELKASDLPEAWAQGMKKYLDIIPESDANGCMQDIHWMRGWFGYFPCYSLGAMSASQIMGKMFEDLSLIHI